MEQDVRARRTADMHRKVLLGGDVPASQGSAVFALAGAVRGAVRGLPRIRRR